MARLTDTEKTIWQLRARAEAAEADARQKAEWARAHADNEHRLSLRVDELETALQKVADGSWAADSTAGAKYDYDIAQFAAAALGRA